MGILGIDNRTENWKTARTFAPFFEDANLRLKLAGRLGEPSGTPPSDISMELFWKGMRDFHHPNGRKGMDVADFARRYDWLFGPEGNIDLRNAIKSLKHLDGLPFKCLQDHNYVAKRPYRILCNNLFYPEIDVVLESPGFLYIGEAKSESVFSTDAPYVLVHQLIREYVMASVLLDYIGSVKKVVPFVVWDMTPEDSLPVQVSFMKQYGLKLLQWSDIKALSS